MRFWRGWLALAGMLFLGCPTGGDDDTVADDDAADDDAADDDAADDDAGDDDAGDDDTGDDDTGDDDTSPIGHELEMSILATGGPAGGPATTVFSLVWLDVNCDELCRVTFEFLGDYVHGAAQGDDFWNQLDEIVTWTSGQEIFNDCPPSLVFYKGDPVDWFRWYMHPVAAISCETVSQDPALAATFVGDDPHGLGDGTLGGYCGITGPGIQSQLGSGPVEGVWLTPGTSGSLDGLGTYGYFPPADTTNVPVWRLMGLMMATVDNPNEPTPGLEGGYLYAPFWDFYAGGC